MNEPKKPSFSKILEVKERLFDAYSGLDFNDLAEMINHRGGVCIKDKENLNSAVNLLDYFAEANTATDYFFIDHVVELQQYVKAICEETLERWISEYEYEELEHSEFFCWRTKIFVTISKDGENVEISYVPISSVNL